MKMIKSMLLISGFIISPFVIAGNNHGGMNESAMNNASRSTEVKARDAGRKPADILNFYGIKPGMTVLDFAAGGGYYTEILSYAVGEKGKVYAQNNPRRSNDTLKSILAKLPNAEGMFVPGVEMELAENSMDAVFITLIFHHMHYNKETPEVLPERSIQVLNKIHKGLKPGGVLAIIEHAALKGTNRADSASLHRIEEDTTIADITAQGFTFAGSSDLLHFKDDDRSKHFRQGGKRDTSWRLVHKYIKN